jgi:agmatinase
MTDRSTCHFRPGRLARTILALLLPAALALPASAAEHACAEGTDCAAIEIPAALLERLEGIDPAKIDFLRSEAVYGFAARHELLFERLLRREPAQIEAYIDGMITVTEEMAFDAERDAASIPLNTNAASFNAFRVRRPAAFDPPREPGPFSVHRYSWAGPKLGIPTFLMAPVALTPEDLEAGEVDVAIMGAGLDMGTGTRGASYGPRALRTGTQYLYYSDNEPEHMHTMVSPTSELSIVDYGDIGVDQLSHERSVGHIREMVAEVAATGAIPVIIGGDHSLMYPDVAGVVDVYGPGNVGVVHFDAHYDAGTGQAHLLSHGQPVYRLFEEGLVPGENFIQVGLRGFWPSREGFEWMREHGLRYHTMAEVERDGWDAVMKRAVREAREGPEHLFISFDVDVLDPAYMPGTGTPEPGGLTTREAFPIIRRLCAETNVVGFELVELNPLVDPGYTTAQNADRVIRECLTGIAMRKLGLVEEHYLSPLTVDHGRGD